MQDSTSLVSSRYQDLWFPQLHSLRISLNKLARHMPISTYVRQERVYPTGRPKPSPIGRNIGRLPIPIPKQDRERNQLPSSFLNISGDREGGVGTRINADGKNNPAGWRTSCEARRVGEEKFSAVF